MYFFFFLVVAATAADNRDGLGQGDDSGLWVMICRAWMPILRGQKPLARDSVTCVPRFSYGRGSIRRRRQRDPPRSFGETMLLSSRIAPSNPRPATRRDTPSIANGHTCVTSVCPGGSDFPRVARESSLLQQTMRTFRRPSETWTITERDVQSRAALAKQSLVRLCFSRRTSG